MSVIPAKITLPDHRQGDYWGGITITIALDLTGCAIKADFFVPNGQAPAKRFSTVDNTITIQSSAPAGSVITLNGFVANMPVSKLIGDLQVTYPDGKPYTYFEITWPIVKQYTT